MKQFIYDMINMTEGQKFIKYWWIFAIMLAIAIILAVIQSKLDKDIMDILKEIDKGDKE